MRRMTSEVAISDPVDPLSSLSVPSLFPRTIRASTNEPFLSDFKDLDSIHHFIKSMKSKSTSPETLLEAKSIVDGGSELLNSNFAAFTMSMGIDNTGPTKENEKPRERRPALGHKRARFSLKTNSSQIPEISEPTLNFDELEDPEECIKAFERVENAKKEIQRQKGGSNISFDEINLSQNTRRRRPALSRKSVAYKHLYSIGSSEEEEETFIPSQMSENDDTFPLDLTIPTSPNNESLQKSDDSNGYSPDKDVSGSVSKEEDKVNKLLDTLLSRNMEDLDGDKAANYLQEKFQCKPIEINPLELPDFPDISTDFMINRKQLKPQRTSLEFQNLLKGVNKETEASSSLASPTPPKSPFASLSLMSKRIMKSNNSSEDPFSPLNIDNLHDQSLIEDENILMDEPDIMKENVEDNSREVMSPTKEHDNSDKTKQTEKDVVIEDESDVNTTTKEHESNSKQELKKPNTPKNVQQKRKRLTVGKNERKTLSSRPSIVDGGTLFEDGVRRSKRVRSRPLEYWKGERFLYGRVNGGVKLLGLKYISPSKGEGGLKVKPYVSNEYKELIDLAAKH